MSIQDDELVREDQQPDPHSDANADANADSLRLSDRLRMRIRSMEREGSAQPFKHRIALIGMAELDGKRPLRLRSGAFRLLEAVYAKGQAHWTDPILAIAGLRELLFKEQAPPGSDRGLFYVLQRVAAAGISPAAFASHIIVPRMQRDHDWRRWRARHTWVLDTIADLLIDLRKAPPWNAPRIASDTILSDIALCKYVGRPLARLSGSRIENQEAHLAAWTGAWKSLSLKDERFLSFLRAALLPCFYRLSGKIDPEQLAPMGRSIFALEKSLAPRLSAMSEGAYRAVMAQESFAGSMDKRIERRSGSESLAWDLVQELKAYLEVLVGLARFDAGPSLMGEAASISLRSDPAYLRDAARMLELSRAVEGAGLLHWQLEALAKLDPEARALFLEELRQAGGFYPAYPARQPLSPAGAYFPAPIQALAALSDGSTELSRLAITLPATLDCARLRPAHADALRAALSPGLEQFEALILSIVQGQGDPEAGQLFALLGQEQKRLKDSLEAAKDAEPEHSRASAALEARISVLESLFQASLDIPAASRDPRRFALACLGAALALEPSAETARLLTEAALLSKPPDVSGRVSALAERLKREYSPFFLGARQASMALDLIDAILDALAGDERLAASLSQPDENFAVVIQAASGRFGTKHPTLLLMKAFRQSIGSKALHATLAKWRDLLAKNAQPQGDGQEEIKAFLTVPVLAQLYGRTRQALAQRAEAAARDAGCWALSLGQSGKPGLLAYGIVRALPAERGLLWQEVQIDSALELSMGTKELMGVYLALRAMAEELAQRERRALALPFGKGAPAFSDSETLNAMALNYERSADTAGAVSVTPAALKKATALVIIDPSKPHTL
ncbi:MAG TPA: hypothetical protein DCG47_14070 [Spirochaetaceae bacterium]|nr:hypothetical protein [Spirochaetaceae bacterium]